MDDEVLRGDYHKGQLILGANLARLNHLIRCRMISEGVGGGENERMNISMREWTYNFEKVENGVRN